MYLFIINLLRNIIISNLPNKCLGAQPKGCRASASRSATCSGGNSSNRGMDGMSEEAGAKEQRINQHESQYREREEFTMCRSSGGGCWKGCHASGVLRKIAIA